VENPPDHRLALKDHPNLKQTVPFAEAVIAATEAVQKEQRERPLTPFDDPSSDEDDDEDYKPKYKDVFGSFGMRSSQTACDKPPC